MGLKIHESSRICVVNSAYNRPTHTAMLPRMKKVFHLLIDNTNDAIDFIEYRAFYKKQIISRTAQKEIYETFHSKSKGQSN